MALLSQFRRVAQQARVEWALLENVPGVPDLRLEGYRVQRLNLNAAECGSPQNRLRCFQFAYRHGSGLVLEGLRPRPRRAERCCLASEGGKVRRRSFADFCALQGLPAEFDLPGLTQGAKYRAVGNGVPLPMGRVLAIAVRHRCVTAEVKVCICDCGRPVKGNALHAGASCRKRMERRRRDSSTVTRPGPDTPGRSR